MDLTKYIQKSIEKKLKESGFRGEFVTDSDLAKARERVDVMLEAIAFQKLINIEDCEPWVERNWPKDFYPKLKQRVIDAYENDWEEGEEIMALAAQIVVLGDPTHGGEIMRIVLAIHEVCRGT